MTGIFIEGGDGEKIVLEELEEAIGFAGQDNFVRDRGVADGEERWGRAPLDFDLGMHQRSIPKARAWHRHPSDDCGAGSRA